MAVRYIDAWHPKAARLHPVTMAADFYQLSQLLAAGVSVSDALGDLETSVRRRSEQCLWAQVALGVDNGKNLSEALSSATPVTDETVLALIGAGEASGNLQSACQAASDHLQWQHDLRQRILTILIYPLFSVCLLVVVTGFLLISVVPSVKGFLISMGGNLEWHTHLLIDTSAWLSIHYHHMLIGCVFFIAGSLLLVRFSQSLQRIIDRGLVGVPVMGRLLTNLSLSRYIRSCASLYASGVALERSLELAEATVSNQAIRSTLRDARHEMVAGMSLAESLGRLPVLPPIVSRMIHVGERSGRLAEVLHSVGNQLATATDVSIKRMEQLMAPIILLFVGLVLLWIVVSVLGPVYNMAIATVMEAR